MVYPEGGGPFRALFLGAMTRAYYESTDDERRERILPRFKQLADEWMNLGAKILATVDDDLLMVGEPQSTGFTFYIVAEVERVETVVEMIQRIRETVEGIRMDAYIRFEARIGRPFFLLEPPA
ncbi:MAG: hypothetical protein ACXWZ1_06600 [Gaiellaceae bacterium]